MKQATLFLLPIIVLFACEGPEAPAAESELKDYTAYMQVDSGEATNVKFTSYSTTLIADGQDKARLRITVIDSAGREITNATNEIKME